MTSRLSLDGRHTSLPAATSAPQKESDVEATPSLVGRDDDLRKLEGIVRATADGTGGSVVVEGPAGIGKSRLLATAMAEAGRLGMVVAAGQATELDRAAPLSTLMTSLRYGGPPELGVAALARQEGSRFCLVDRLGEMIEDYVRMRPLVIALDDAHWADELTALALRILIPALSSSPALWLLARRPVPSRSPAQDAIDWLLEDGSAQLRLDPLADDAVAKLCADLLGSTPEPAVLELVARCGGNPFLVEQLLITLKNEGRVVITAGTAAIVGGGLPASFSSAVKDRLRHLSDDARWLLAAGSVLGRPFTVHEASRLVGRSPLKLLATALEAVESGTLKDSGAKLAFRHDVIREATYSNLAGPIRLALHREAALLVQAEGRSPLEIAEHLLHSDQRGGDEAARLLRQAATDSIPTAPAKAADLLLRLLDLLPESDPSRPQTTTDAVRLLAATGRVAEARKLGESALLLPDLEAPVEANVLLGLAETLKHAGHNEAAISCTRRALAAPGAAESVRAHLFAVQAHGLLEVDDMEGAEAAGAEASASGKATGQHAAFVSAATARSVVARSRGDLQEAVRLAREAMAGAESAGGEAGHRNPGLWLGKALASVDRVDEADDVYSKGQRDANQLGTASSQPLWHCYRAELRLVTGHLDDAHAEAETGVRISERLNVPQLSVPLLALLARVALHRSEMAETRALLEQAHRLVSEGTTIACSGLVWATALFEDAKGKPAAAVEMLADVYGRLASRSLLLSNESGAAAALVRIALRAGASAEAQVAAEAARILALRNPTVASLVGDAAHAEGLLRDDRESLRSAIRHYRSSPRPLARAGALEDVAAAEHASGRRKEAVQALEEALEHYVIVGAGREVARVQNRLRSFGVRPRRRQPRDTPARSSELTESELRVVRLVTEGLTNREVAGQLYLSPHTVDSHLRHVFIKLGLKSRVQLTREFLGANLEARRMAQA